MDQQPTITPMPPAPPVPTVVPTSKPKRNIFVWIVGGIIVLGIGMAMGWFLSRNSARILLVPKQNISSYEECVEAKNSIVQYSYPATCVTRDGKRFIQPLTDEEKRGLLPPDLNRELTDSAATASQAPNGDLANWKTYTDGEAGFSLKYPNNYFIFQGDPSVELPRFFVATAPPQGGVGPKFLPNPTDVWLGAYGSKNINFQTVDQYLTIQGDSFNTATKIPTTIGGINGYKVVSTIQSYCAGDLCTTIYVYDGLVLKNNSIYVISMSSLDQKALYANKTMFDQILSTFKFVDK